MAFAFAFAFATLASCGGDPEKYDWRNRELAWKYGPTRGTASPTHLRATGTRGGKPLAQGWRIHLVDGHRMTVQPYRLAPEHKLFGKTTLAIEMFDKNSEPIDTLVTDPLTRDRASFTFELDEGIARRVYDLILWYRKAP